MFVPFKPAPSKQLSRTPDAPQRWTVGQPQAGDSAYAYGFNCNIMKAPVQNIRPQFLDGTNRFLQPDNLRNRRIGKLRPKPILTKSTAMSQYGWCGTRFPPPYPQYHNSIECQEYESALKRQRTNSTTRYTSNYFNAALPTDVSSIINMSNNIFGHTTNVVLPSSQEITASQKAESADDYILSIYVSVQNNHN